ncbi:hypothetical protein AAFF_G00425400 [Aldrovandia affinis]|uniref:Uncharacterized protein n=1 Tax=Aldrovandia affinis TaxID=143900 RepID=A0AAD7X094_9TELE|nr:hypothetical protein AAFF_G00425400 [Aldrovandia affinis]
MGLHRENCSNFFLLRELPGPRLVAQMLSSTTFLNGGAEGKPFELIMQNEVLFDERSPSATKRAKVNRSRGSSNEWCHEQRATSGNLKNATGTVRREREGGHASREVGGRCASLHRHAPESKAAQCIAHAGTRHNLKLSPSAEHAMWHETTLRHMTGMVACLVS